MGYNSGFKGLNSALDGVSSMPHGPVVVNSSWNVMAHGDAREGKWRGNWRMDCVASTLHLLPLMRTPRLPVVDWTHAPADLNELVRFAKRQNLVSARVPSHFIWPLSTKKEARVLTEQKAKWYPSRPKI